MTLALREQKYLSDQTILKVYGYGDHRKIKITTMAYLRNSGIEDDEEEFKRGGVNENKLEDNISRAKDRIFDLAFCNPWQYFFTGTLDRSKYNRQDLEKFHKDLTQWIRDLNKKPGYHIKFLFIPELHADGQSWHVHGFLMGLPADQLTQFRIGDRMGKAIADKVIRGDVVYNWTAYANKFGFCDLEPIKNHEAVSKYVTKYINKNLGKCVSQLGAHLYYHSRGLQTAEVVKQGYFFGSFPVSYTGEFCSVGWLDYSDELLQKLMKGFDLDIGTDPP